MPSGGQGSSQLDQKKIEDALKLIADKLKGTVALVLKSSRVELLVSDYRDTQRVGPVIKALDPSVSIKVVTEDKWPDDAIRVA